MTYVIAGPCIGVKDTACVDACPVDCIHPKKGTNYDDGRPSFGEVSIQVADNPDLLKYTEKEFRSTHLGKAISVTPPVDAVPQ